MENCDLHIRATGPIEDYVSMASRLGLDEICMVHVVERFDKYSLKGFKEFQERVNALKSKVTLHCGVELSPKPQNLQRAVREFRCDADVIIARGDESLNRAASECWELDVIASPYLSGDKDFMHQRNSGVDYTIARNCAERGIAIEFAFSDILNAARRRRLLLLGRMMQNVKTCRDSGAPILISSSASTPYEMRSQAALSSFAGLIGLQDLELSRALSGTPDVILERTTHRNDESVLLKGLKVLEWGDSKIIRPKKIYGWY